MVDAFGLGDVSTKDTGKGSKLETGGRREHNMAKCKEGFIKVRGKCVSLKQAKQNAHKSLVDSLKTTKGKGRMGPGPDESPTLRDRATKSKKWKSYQKKYGG